MKIGIIKGGIFDVREINEYQTKMELPDGSISTVIMTVEAQLEEYAAKGWKPVEDIDVRALGLHAVKTHVRQYLYRNYHGFNTVTLTV